MKLHRLSCSRPSGLPSLALVGRMSAFVVMTLLALAGARRCAAHSGTDAGVITAVKAFVKAPAVSSYDDFGFEVAISGDRAIVGAEREGSSFAGIVMHPTGLEPALLDNNSPKWLDSSAKEGYLSGAAYILVRDSAPGGNWKVEAFVKPPVVSSGDLFGTSVAISGDRAVVGAENEDSNIAGIVANPTGSDEALRDGGGSTNFNSGAAYILVRDPISGNWNFEAFVKAPAISGGDRFGEAVAISGDRVLVGASYEDSNIPGVEMNPTGNNPALSDDSQGSNFNSGAAYILARDSSSGKWAFEAFVKAPAFPLSAGDNFGRSVAISSDRIIIGAPYESSSVSGIVMNPVGSEPALSDNGASDSGAAYILSRDAVSGNWEYSAYLKAPAVSSNDAFGYSVDISGERAIVGAAWEDSQASGIVMHPTGAEPALTDNSTDASGAAYILSLGASGSWTFDAFVKPLSVTDRDYFGYSVAVSGDRAIIGAYGDDGVVGGVLMQPTGCEPALNSGKDAGPYDGSGAAYVLSRDAVSGIWGFQAFVKPPVVGAMDMFGLAVDISGDHYIIGVPEDSAMQGIVTNPTSSDDALKDNGATKSGAAYVYQTHCDAGFAPTGPGLCEACPAGTSSSNGSACELCPPGTFTVIPASATCLQCPVNIQASLRHSSLIERLCTCASTEETSSDHQKYVSDALAEFSPRYQWRVCIFHKNQRKLQRGDKSNEVGWEIYETCRQYGALI